MRELTAEQLKQLMAGSKENAFLIVDVRQASEYRLDHIPGAVNIPLGEVEFDPFVFDEKRKVIFYCRNGCRSKVAAVIAADSGLEKENIFHLRGGVNAYTGEILLDIPRVDHFPSGMRLVEILERAINFEKGAFLFYDRVKLIFKGTPLYETMVSMSQAEVGHAKIIFKVLDALEPSGLSFERIFDICLGDILEGGKPIGEIEKFLEAVSPENRVDIIEFAIELEFCAYDLYKVMSEKLGEKLKDAELKNMFLTLAEAEKNHLSMLINCLELLYPE